MSATMTSLSFQPWSRAPTEEAALKDVLARVNLERGHFRDITEASLQGEIAAEGRLDPSESESEDEDEEGDTEPEKAWSQPATREELFRAKHEMLQQVAYAHNEVMLALDFVSLLESKDAPTQGKQTMSESLKQTVPAGTLGTDIWHRMPIDKAREAEDELLSRNVRLASLQQSADSLLGAAKRLEDNVRKEIEYWDQVLAVSGKGWNVCRLPSQQSRLGVRFGFSESAAQFSRRGVAALNLGSDGNITLQRGVGGKAEALRATVRRDGRVVGSSLLAVTGEDEEVTLEARIRHARDSLFDEELFHEMIRESRLLSSLGVQTKGSSIKLSANHGDGSGKYELTFELQPLDKSSIPDMDASHGEDNLAQALVLAARLLLSHAHRQKLKRRSEIPPPLTYQKEERPVMPILRPIISFLLHRANLDELNAYLDRVRTLLASASIGVHVTAARLTLPAQEDITSAAELTSTFMQPWKSDASLTIHSPDRGGSDLPPALEYRIATSLAQPQPTTVSLNLSGDKKAHYPAVDDVMPASDSLLASKLAATLQTRMGEGWRCNEREAAIVRSGEIGEEARQIWVDVDSEAGMLALCSDDRKAAWRLERESARESFWEAVGELVKG